MRRWDPPAPSLRPAPGCARDSAALSQCSWNCPMGPALGFRDIPFLFSRIPYHGCCKPSCTPQSPWVSYSCRSWGRLRPLCTWSGAAPPASLPCSSAPQGAPLGWVSRLPPQQPSATRGLTFSVPKPSPARTESRPPSNLEEDFFFILFYVQQFFLSSPSNTVLEKVVYTSKSQFLYYPVRS